METVIIAAAVTRNIDKIAIKMMTSIKENPSTLFTVSEVELLRVNVFFMERDKSNRHL